MLVLVLVLVLVLMLASKSAPVIPSIYLSTTYQPMYLSMVLGARYTELELLTPTLTSNPSPSPSP